MIKPISIIFQVKTFLNSIPNNTISDRSKLKPYADDKFYIRRLIIFVFEMDENTVEKGKKKGSFSKDLFVRVVKSRDCVVRVNYFAI